MLRPEASSHFGSTRPSDGDLDRSSFGVRIAFGHGNGELVLVRFTCIIIVFNLQLSLAEQYMRLLTAVIRNRATHEIFFQGLRQCQDGPCRTGQWPRLGSCMPLLSIFTAPEHRIQDLPRRVASGSSVCFCSIGFDVD